MRPKWAPPSRYSRVAAAGPEAPFPACLYLDQAHADLVSHTPCLYPEPPLKVEGLQTWHPAAASGHLEASSVFYQRCCRNLLWKLVAVHVCLPLACCCVDPCVCWVQGFGLFLQHPLLVGSSEQGR